MHDPATGEILATLASATSGGTDLSETLGGVLKTGVQVLACSNSLRSAGLGPGGLESGVGTVPAAVGHLAQRQWDGWACIRL